MEIVQNKFAGLKEKCTKKNLLFMAEMAFYLFCFLKMSLNLCYGVESEFQTFRDIYDYEAICYFLAIIIIATRAKFWHWICLIYAGLYTTGCILYMKKMMFEPEKFQAVEMQMIAYGLFFLLVLDLLIRRQVVKWKERNPWLTGILAFAVIFTWIFSIGRNNTIFLFCPFAVLYLVRISKEKWMHLMYCFSISHVLSVVWIFGKSLMTVPYDGSRYWGVFLNLSTIGMFCAGAFVCAMFWFLLKSENRFKISWRFVPILGVMIMSVMFVSMISARSAMVALAAPALFAFIFWPSKHGKNVVRKRFYGVLIGILVCLILGFILLWGLYQIDKEELRRLITNDVIYNKVEYWYIRAKTMFQAKSRLFEHGTVLAMIDRFSSGRLGIWVNYMANFNWLGHVSTYLEEVKPHRLHAHNTYVSNIYNYGLIGGGAYLLWNIGLLAESVRKSLTGKKIYILPALWIALTLTGMLTETLFFVYPLPFIMLFLQYPLLVRIDGEDGEAVTGKDGKKCIKEKRKKEKRKNVKR